jgi:heme A synthase
MDPFSYLSVLTSIVLALGITRILTGLGRLLQKRGRVRVYWVHLMWGLNLFLYLTLNWWILFRWQAQQQWTFFLFLFVLISPTIGFLLSVLLFPDEIDDGSDLKRHFYHNHRSYFLLAALLFPVDAIDTLLKGWQHFLNQGPVYFLTLTLLCALCLVAAFTKNERYHAVFSVFFLIYLLAFITINLRVLA